MELFFGYFNSFFYILQELFSFGKDPYHEVGKNNDIVSYVKSGGRLHKPDVCSDEIYELMKKCWSEEATNRPTFLNIVKALKEYDDCISCN